MQTPCQGRERRRPPQSSKTRSAVRGGGSGRRLYTLVRLLAIPPPEAVFPSKLPRTQPPLPTTTSRLPPPASTCPGEDAVSRKPRTRRGCGGPPLYERRQLQPPEERSYFSVHRFQRQQPNASRMSRARHWRGVCRRRRRPPCRRRDRVESDGAGPLPVNPTTDARGAGAGVGSIR